MATTPSSTTHVGISDARARLTSLVNEVYRGGSRIVVEKSGIPVAAVVSPADLDRLEQLDRLQDEERLAELEHRARLSEAWTRVNESRRNFADVPPDELWERAVADVDELREERRATQVTSASTRR